MDANENGHYFEGVEKLMEIWFYSNNKHANDSLADLRLIPRVKLEAVLTKAKCTIVSHMFSDTTDAYILSESSLFVFRSRLILKTCGTTCLLDCIPLLLTYVLAYTSFNLIVKLFYSRKNFLRPHLQPDIYRTFHSEIEFLDKYFSSGQAYCFGRLNADRWYLYTVTEPFELFAGASSTPLGLPARTLLPASTQDQTLEIVMMELDAGLMALFTREAVQSRHDSPEYLSRIGVLFPPSMIVDDIMFDPCGYSMNGLQQDNYYMTIHITPEKKFSYVSLETNVPFEDYNDFILTVYRCFRPSKMIVTLFASQNSTCRQYVEGMQLLSPDGSMHCKDKQVCQVSDEYMLLYTFLCR